MAFWTDDLAEYPCEIATTGKKIHDLIARLDAGESNGFGGLAVGVAR